MVQNNSVGSTMSDYQVDFTLPYDQRRVEKLIKAVVGGESKKTLNEYFSGIKGVDQLKGNQGTIVGRIANKKVLLAYNGLEEQKDGTYKALSIDDLKKDVENGMGARKIQNRYSGKFDVANQIDRNKTQEDIYENLVEILRYTVGDTKPQNVGFSDLYRDVGKGIGKSKLKSKYKDSDVASLVDLLNPQQSGVDHIANQEKLMRHEMYGTVESAEISTLHKVIEDIYAGASVQTLSEKHGKTFSVLGALDTNWSWKSRAENATSILKQYVDSVSSDEELIGVQTLCEENLSLIESKQRKISNYNSTWDEIDEALSLLENELPESITYALSVDKFAEPTIIDDDHAYNGTLTEPSTGWEVDEENDDWLGDEIKTGWISSGKRNKLAETLYADKRFLDTELGYAFFENGFYTGDKGGKRIASKVIIGPKNSKFVDNEKINDSFDWIDGQYLGEYEPITQEMPELGELVNGSMDDDWLKELSLDISIDEDEEKVIDLSAPLKELEAKGHFANNLVADDTPTREYVPEVESKDDFDPTARGIYPTARKAGLVFVDPEPAEVHSRNNVINSSGVTQSIADEERLLDLLKDKRDLSGLLKKGSVLEMSPKQSAPNQDVSTWELPTENQTDTLSHEKVEKWFLPDESSFNERGTYETLSKRLIPEDDSPTDSVLGDGLYGTKEVDTKGRKTKRVFPKVAAGVLAALAASLPSAAGSPAREETVKIEKPFVPIPTGQIFYEE